MPKSLLQGVLVTASLTLYSGSLTAQNTAPAAQPQTTIQPQAVQSQPNHGSAGNTSKPTRRKTATSTQTLPIETAPVQTPPSAATQAQQARQSAADQRLLQQQQVQSEKAAQVNDQVVDRAQRQQERLQNQTRIEDAPGPSQTGVVPVAGGTLVPPVDTRGVQDAPGPNQTLPPPTAATPGQAPAASQNPAATPTQGSPQQTPPQL